MEFLSLHTVVGFLDSNSSMQIATQPWDQHGLSIPRQFVLLVFSNGLCSQHQNR